MSKRGENIYKRKDGRWEGRYHKGRTEDGKLLYGYVYSKSYLEVKQRVYALKAKYDEIREVQGECALAFSAWVDSWLREIKPFVKGSTFFSYTYKLKKYVTPYLTQSLNECTKEVIQGLLETLSKRGLFASTIQVIFRIVKKCFQHAVDQGLLEKNPCTNVQLPKRNPTSIRALTMTEQKSLERVASTDVSKKSLPILLALRTGLRIGEISALRWENIDLSQRFITVNHTLQRVQSEMNGASRLEVTAPKTTASVRRIPLGEKVVKWLKTFKKQTAGTGFVFSTKQNPCEPRLISYHFQQLLRRAGLKGLHFHQLRHTFATRCLESKADIASVSALLGHSSAKMTLDIYADSMLEQRKKVMHALDRHI